MTDNIEILLLRMEELCQERSACLDDITCAEQSAGRPHPNRGLWGRKGERLAGVNDRLGRLECAVENLAQNSD